MGGQQSVIPGGGSEGYHVLRVQDGSPGFHAGLEPFFDFIVAIGNTRLDQDNETFKDLLKANIDKHMQMTIYSSKTQQLREISIVPSNMWGGQGLLGISIRFCSFEGATENVWHVLDVQTNSPAAIAGLHSDTDYIIGSDQVLNERDDFFMLVETSDGQPIKVYVYSALTDGVRELTLTPNSKWGGEGMLGCDIGYGYLHRIPTPETGVETVALDMKYTPTQTQAAVTSGMANLNLAPPPPTNAAANANPPPPMFAPQNFALNPGHMPIPASVSPVPHFPEVPPLSAPPFLAAAPPSAVAPPLAPPMETVAAATPPPLAAPLQIPAPVSLAPEVLAPPAAQPMAPVAQEAPPATIPVTSVEQTPQIPMYAPQSMPVPSSIPSFTPISGPPMFAPPQPPSFGSGLPPLPNVPQMPAFPPMSSAAPPLPQMPAMPGPVSQAS
ncbi:Golgi reassembly-stacking protein 2-like isoform X2 [Bolinopsis microptera]|uniref:Golgi reassembly-stacking protein 2-like isoform X2 n=1 Tax=Bolinopsis microptera TaxID=2820187 RepID=UPI003079BAF9